MPQLYFHEKHGTHLQIGTFNSGLTGPRGKPGRSGIPGVPGVPGVNTWVVNTTDPRRIVLVPPSILGVDIIVSLFATI